MWVKTTHISPAVSGHLMIGQWLSDWLEPEKHLDNARTKWPSGDREDTGRPGCPPEQTGRTAAEMREALKQNCTFPQNVKITILGRNSIQWFEKEIALISTIWQAGRNSPSFLGERKDVQLWLLSHCHQDGKKKKKKQQVEEKKNSYFIYFTITTTSCFYLHVCT